MGGEGGNGFFWGLWRLYAVIRWPKGAIGRYMGGEGGATVAIGSIGAIGALWVIGGYQGPPGL